MMNKFIGGLAALCALGLFAGAPASAGNIRTLDAVSGFPFPDEPPSVSGEPASIEPTTHHGKEYKELARQMAASGMGFPEIFAGLCRHMLDGNSRVRLHPKSEVRSLFKGLIDWTREGARPIFQDRPDLALHFIYGGYIAAALGQTAAERAAYEREKDNAHQAGNSFDLDDFGATLYGAHWVAGLGQDWNAIAGWVRQWTQGSRRLDRLAPLRFGRMPPGQLAGPELLKTVRDFTRAAMLADPHSFN